MTLRTIDNALKQRIRAFVNYEKAFKWAVQFCGESCIIIALKYVNLIKFIHEHSQCKVNNSGVLSNEFPVNSGILQWNMVSPTLFILLMDFVMHRTVRDGGEGLDWIGNRKLADLEYGEDAALIKNQNTT
ncbi:uncharacterized protein [Palaemon carinicauda]|uniref:uncharacterized protein n=1 Tax=Palaemon carinicauda TaxID=392227 RepID=UPI0035B64EE1